MAVEEVCGFTCGAELGCFSGTGLHTTDTEFCEHFVNKSGTTMLVEAGLDWYPLEAQSAHNQRQIKDFPRFSEFYLGDGDQSCNCPPNPINQISSSLSASCWTGFGGASRIHSSRECVEGGRGAIPAQLIDIVEERDVSSKRGEFAE
jgi:hypothetical protein